MKIIIPNVISKYALVNLFQNDYSLALRLAFTEKHVPYAQHGGPGQRAGEHAHEPFRHVQDRVNALLLLQTNTTEREAPSKCSSAKACYGGV